MKIGLIENVIIKLVADESGRKLEALDEEWPEARVVGQIGERTIEEKREEEGEEGEREDETDDYGEDEEEIGDIDQTQTSQEDNSVCYF